MPVADPSHHPADIRLSALTISDLPEAGPVSGILAQRIARGEIEFDAVQAALALKLDALAEKLENRRLATKTSSLGWLFSKRQKAEPVKGIYIHGAVGRGKSMLMDLFFQRVAIKRKRRAHFHDFMADAQDRIQTQRDAFKAGSSKEEDPIPPVARALAEEAQLLCFDEFTITDIADAMILGRLFKGLFERNVVIVATSNVAPDDLYRDGLNRQLFLPFIDVLKSHCEVHQLDARTDYRMEKLASVPVYLTPLDDAAALAFETAWAAATVGKEPKPRTIELKGRKIPVPLATESVARFTFDGLCVEPLGARDYLAIAKRFRTVFLANVPKMDGAMRNPAKRFINLIDTLYDNQIRLVITADGEPDALYQGKNGTEAFEFARTASRLNEMRSADWLAAGET